MASKSDLVAPSVAVAAPILLEDETEGAAVERTLALVFQARVLIAAGRGKVREEAILIGIPAPASLRS